MSKLPSLSSSKLVKLLTSGGAEFVRQGKTDHAKYILDWLRTGDIRLQSKWAKRPWIRFIAKGSFDSLCLPMMKSMIYSINEYSR